MTSLKDHKAGTRTKVLMVAENGAGKTGLLATLANAGKQVRIADFDDGLDILLSYIEPDKIGNVRFETFSDNIASPNDWASSYTRFKNLIYTGWKTQSDDLGHITTWDSDTVLVIDSLSGLAEAVMRHVMRLSGKRSTDNPSQPDWGAAQREIINLCSYILGSSVKCNVVINTHPVLITDQAEITRMYPNACGRALSTSIGKYFNNVWRIDVKPDGKRVIRTVSDHRSSLKSSAPTVLAKEEDFDLAKVFAKMQGQAQTKLTKDAE